MAQSKLISKTVEQQLKNTQTLSSATSHYKGLEAEWAKILGVSGAAALVTLLGELGPQLDSRGATLEEREQQLNEERQDDEPVRQKRDQASAQLNTTLISAKGVVSSTFGEEALVGYGLSGANPATPDARHKYARNAINLLRKDKREQTDMLGRKTSTEDIAAFLEQAAAPLDMARSDETREALELTDALSRRDEGATQLDALSTFSKQLIDAALRLAGQDDAADKLATNLRQSARGGAAEPLPLVQT